MDISVIVPIHKVEKFVERCLRSLFDQTKTDGVEFILVNDATPDDSMIIANRVISEYPNLNIRVINHEKNRGITITRQTGLDASNGKYVLYVDSDDWCDISSFEQVFSKAETEDADIVLFDFFYYYSDDNLVAHAYRDNSSGLDYVKESIKGCIWGHLVSKFFKRSLITDNGISFIDGINIGEDFLVSVKLFRFAKKVINYHQPFYFYNQTNVNSITTTRTSNIGTIKQYYEYLNIELEKFLYKEGLLPLFEEDLIKRKLKDKIEVLFLLKHSDRRHVANIHPEVNKYIWGMKNVSTIVRFSLIQATKGRVFIFSIMAWIRSIVKY